MVDIQKLIFAILSSALPMAATLAPFSDDAKVLQGVWTPVKWELAGSATPPPSMSAMKLTLKDAQFEFLEGKSLDAGRFELKPGQTPKEMDIVGVKGPNAGRTIPTIYRIQGDRLTVCYGLDGHRPKSFLSPKKSMILLVVFSRKPLIKR